MDSKAKRDIDAKIQESYLPRVPEGVNLEIAIEVGKDYPKILDFAEQKDIDLIVMGRQGRSSFGKFFFGSVTEKVTRKANARFCRAPDLRREASPEGIRISDQATTFFDCHGPIL